MADWTPPDLDRRHLVGAFQLLTRLPVPGTGHGGGAAAWAWPLVGLALAGMAGACGTLALWLGLPPSLAALIALAVLVITTGALHEDGLADTADGFWGGHDQARRLEIMRDSRIGSYGVIALVLSLAARWAALTALFAAGSTLAPLLIAAAGSRAAMAVAMHRLRHARRDGLSHHTGRPDRATVWLALGIAAVTSLGLIGLALLPLALVAVLTLTGAVHLCRRKIGGQTGDTLGATQQVTEIALLCTLVALI